MTLKLRVLWIEFNGVIDSVRYSLVGWQFLKKL